MHGWIRFRCRDRSEISHAISRMEVNSLFIFPGLRDVFLLIHKTLVRHSFSFWSGDVPARFILTDDLLFLPAILCFLIPV